MSITIGNITFDHASYDERGDVLYLRVGDRQAAADSLGTPEGHAVRYDSDGEVIGVTIVNARWLLDRDGKITITIPERVDVSADALASALASPPRNAPSPGPTQPGVIQASLSSPFVSRGPEFAAALGDAPRLVRVVAADAHEGPVYVPSEDALYFTSVPRRGGVRASGPPVVAVRRLALDGHRFPLEPERISTLRADANVANGMALDREGRLVICEQGTRSRPAAITREGRRLAESWDGRPLNSPNDVVVKGDGSIWFTDPSYGWLQGFRPQPLVGDHVYRFDPATEAVEVVADGFDKPNGLCFSPDERVLYVADNGAPHHLQAFDVVAGRRLTGERVIAVSTPLHPDGLKVDSAGRIYATCSHGIRVLAPTGALLGEIRLDGAVNFCFGTAERNVLFVTTDDAIWAAELPATGP